MQPLIAALGVYTVPRLSPDGKNLAFISLDSTPQIYDLERETFTLITNRSNNRASFNESRNCAHVYRNHRPTLHLLFPDPHQSS